MKQFIICLIIIFGMFLIVKDEVVIPEEAIRLRIIANSNSQLDQDVKKKVKLNLENSVFSLLKNSGSIEETRDIINDNMFVFDNVVNNTLKQENYKMSYSINFGNNFFPKKEYKGISYDEGVYESLVVTLGKGEGDNWWCVLFPPFCLIEANENTDVEYKFLVKEMIDKYF